MNTLQEILDNYSETEIRSSLYYLGRHLKQASFSLNYEKDIFDDGSKISPSEEVKKLTLALLQFIEDSQKKKSSEFNDLEYNLWITKINEIDSSLDPDITEEKKSEILGNFSKFLLNK